MLQFKLKDNIKRLENIDENHKVKGKPRDVSLNAKTSMSAKQNLKSSLAVKPLLRERHKEDSINIKPFSLAQEPKHLSLSFKADDSLRM